MKIKRFALLVGVNVYQLGKNLTGSVNDVEEFAGLLEKFFPETRIATLTSPPETTRQGIEDAWNELVRDAEDAARDHEVAVIGYFSGHGAVREAVRDGKQEKFESIVPSDSRVPKNLDIFDKEINAAIWQLHEKVLSASGGKRTPHVTLIFDSCFSGEATRDGEAPVPAGVTEKRLKEEDDQQPTSDGEAEELADHEKRLRRKLWALERRYRNRDARWAPRSSRAVVIGACRDDEIAGENAFPPDGHFGNFSRFFQRFLRQAHETIGRDRRITWREVFPRVQRLLKSGEDREIIHRQEPQFFEGSLDQQIFGLDEDYPLVPSLRVTLAEAGEVRLSGGTAHGVERGSIWQIRSEWAHQPEEGEDVAVVRVDKVEGLQAVVSPLRVSEPIEVGQRAFPADAREPELVVFVDAPEIKQLEKERLEAAIELSASLALDAREKAGVVIHARPPRPGVSGDRWRWKAVRTAGESAGTLAARPRAIGTDFETSLRDVRLHLQEVDGVLTGLISGSARAAIEQAGALLSRDGTGTEFHSGAGAAGFVGDLAEYSPRAVEFLGKVAATTDSITQEEFDALVSEADRLRDQERSLASRAEHLVAVSEARAAELVRDLERVVRWRRLLDLRPPDTDEGAELAEKVSLEFFGGQQEGAVVALEDGARFSAEIAYPSGRKPIWLTLLRFDANREISLPLGRSAVPLRPGETLILKNDTWKLAEGFPWPAEEAGEPRTARAALKLLITDQAADFGFYEQAPARGSSTGRAVKRVTREEQRKEKKLATWAIESELEGEDDSTGAAPGAGRWASQTVELELRAGA